MASTSAMSVPATSTKPSILQSIAAARSANLPPKPSSSTSTSTRAVPTSHTGSGGGFQGQDDFISFAELEADVAGRHTDSSNGILAKGKQRAGPGPAAAGEHKRGKKRPIADVLEEQGKTKLRDVDKATPWTAEVDWDSHASATEQLTAEIKAFTRYITPTDQEHDLRSAVVESIRRLITRRWRNAELHPFGSFMTRLYLPTGDIDLVCVIPGVGGPENKLQQTRFLREVSNLLRQSRLGTDIIVIGKARVPIIKFTSVQGGFKIDISVNMTNSIRVYPKVLELFDQVGEEAARSLIMVTKAFLNQRNMNEVHSGGLGSYSIICLVVSFLQLHPKLQRKEMTSSDNLGTLLLEMLEVYGKHFNYDDVGISLAGRGSYYSKHRRGWSNPRGKLSLSIEDPADATNDVSSGSHNFFLVRQSLSGAFEVLTASVYYRTSIILARIASAQSGVHLRTLSGRAIPHANAGEDVETDECRKSLLGAIVGVPADTAAARVEVKRLSELGTVQRSLGLPIAKYDEDGMLYDPSKPKRIQKGRTTAHSRTQSTQSGGSHTRFAPPEPSAPPPTLPPLPPGPPPPTATIRSQIAASKRKSNGKPSPAGSDMDIASPEPAGALSKGVTNGRSDAGNTAGESQAPPTARSFINLDSPSPEPEPRSKTRKQKQTAEEKTEPVLSTQANGTASPASLSKRRASRAKAQGQAQDEQIEEDSRYSVTKGKKPSARTQRQQETQYIALDDRDSESDSDVEVVTSAKEGSDDDVQFVSNGKAAHKGAAGQSSTRTRANANSNGDDTDGRPRTRSRTLSQTHSHPHDAPSASSSSARRNSSTTRSGAQNAPTPPTTIPAKQKREYWSGKGKVDREALNKVEEDAYKYGSDDSDSDDAVEVTSSSAIAAKKKAH